jgi:hypothetical protein
MFDRAAKGLYPIEVKAYDDIGCTGRTGYHVWYGMFVKRRAGGPAADQARYAS